jgi:hypothetical protein
MSEERFVSHGFIDKRRSGEKKDRFPPGQVLTNDFAIHLDARSAVYLRLAHS